MFFIISLSKLIHPLPKFNEFKPRLKSPQKRFQLSAGFNLEKLNKILSGTNHIMSRLSNLSRGSKSLISASCLFFNYFFHTFLVFFLIFLVFILIFLVLFLILRVLFLYFWYKEVVQTYFYGSVFSGAY